MGYIPMGILNNVRMRDKHIFFSHRFTLMFRTRTTFLSMDKYSLEIWKNWKLQAVESDSVVWLVDSYFQIVEFVFKWIKVSANVKCIQ